MLVCVLGTPVVIAVSCGVPDVELLEVDGGEDAGTDEIGPDVLAAVEAAAAYTLTCTSDAECAPTASARWQSAIRATTTAALTRMPAATVARRRPPVI